MGVVYKLTEDIARFVVNRKKADPKLSCRRLVDVVQKKFDVRVSKSSVNKILKDSLLSSPVGRRPGGPGGRPKKFRIPEEKKREIFLSKGPASDGAPEAAFPKEKRVPPPAFRPEQAALRAGPSDDKPLDDGIGHIFLKAAEWEVSREPVLGKYIKKHAKGLSLTDIDTIAEVLFYLKPFGVTSVEAIDQYAGRGLWALHGLKEKIDRDTIVHVLEAVGDVKKLALEMELEAPSLFERVGQIKIFVEDGEAISLDPLMGEALNNVQTGRYLSLNQSIQFVIEKIIENVQSAIFCSVGQPDRDSLNIEKTQESGRIPFSGEFFSIARAFDNTPGKRLKKIAVFDEKNREIAEFDDILEKKRFWSGGIWPWQGGFEKLAWEGKSCRIFVDLLGREYFYKQMRINEVEKKQGLKGFLLFEQKDSPPFVAILSNNSAGSPQEIISGYIQRWPNLEDGHLLHLIRTRRMDQREPEASRQTSICQKTVKDVFNACNYNIINMIYAFEEILGAYCRERFFWGTLGGNDSTYLNSMLCDTAGRIDIKDHIMIVLLEPKERGHIKILESAARIVNESDIRDFQNNRLYIKIKK